MVDYEDPGWNENRPYNPAEFDENSFFYRNPVWLGPSVEWVGDVLFGSMTCDWEKDNLFIRVAAFAKKKQFHNLYQAGYDNIRVNLQVNAKGTLDFIDLKTTDPNTAGSDTDSLYFDSEGRSRDLTGLTIDGKKAPVVPGANWTVTHRVVAKCVEPRDPGGKCSMKSRVEWECRRKPEFQNESSATAAWGARAVLLAGALAGALLA